MDNILVTICARGGSKGVKGKNIRPLCGKPLIAWTIGQVRRWNRIEDLVVSTDSPEIADVAREFGAKVPFMRPKELALDTSPKFPAIRHAVRESERLFGKKYSIVVDLDASSPLRRVEDLESCLRRFQEVRPFSLFSVVRAHRNPYFNMVEEDGQGFVRLVKESSAHRRQDAPAVYDMNASIYFFQRNYLMDEKNLGPVSSRSIVHMMDDISGLDIDREVDFKFVEFVIKEGLFKP